MSGREWRIDSVALVRLRRQIMLQNSNIMMNILIGEEHVGNSPSLVGGSGWFINSGIDSKKGEWA